MGATTGLVNVRTDRALRVVLMLAAAEARHSGGWVQARTMAGEQGVTPKDLERALTDLREAGLVESHRGRYGGFRLTRAPANVTVADVILAMDHGPLLRTRRTRAKQQPVETTSAATTVHVVDRVWRLAERNVVALLDTVTLADVVAGRIPDTR